MTSLCSSVMHVQKKNIQRTRSLQKSASKEHFLKKNRLKRTVTNEKPKSFPRNVVFLSKMLRFSLYKKEDRKKVREKKKKKKERKKERQRQKERRKEKDRKKEDKKRKKSVNVSLYPIEYLNGL